MATATFYNPTGSVQGFQFLHILTNTYSLDFFFFFFFSGGGRADVCEV